VRRLLPLLLLASCAESVASEEVWLAVGRDDLVLEADVSGTLRATRSREIGPPAVGDNWDFKIVKLASEGSEVKAGQAVVSFDLSEVERQLAERTAERDAAAQEIAKKKIDLSLARREGDMRVAEAEATLRKAQLKADLPPQYTAAVEVKLAQIDLEAAEAELAAAKRRLAYQMKLGDAELAFLRDRHSRAEVRVQRLEATSKQMTVRSPVAGLVVHYTSWRGEKKKVGDSCYDADECVEVVDVSEMMGKAEVDETESARMRVGQKARLRLDALPEIEWAATVARIRPTVYRQSPRTPLKVIGMDLALERTDRSRMRPGMQFRGRIETGRVPKVLLLPLEAVFIRPDGPVAFKRTSVNHELVRLQLGRRNSRVVEVLGGLEEGDRVSRRDLEGSR
jgi:multidrug efflux pump subunit AcrA (membrane-fusion protein)